MQAVRRRKGWPLRVLGARRSASSDDGFEDQRKPRPRRVWLRILKVVLAVVVLLALAGGALFVLTPSAGQATALAQAQAAGHHIAYPGPPVPRYFAQALGAAQGPRLYTDPGVDPFALARVVASRVTGRTDQGGSTIDQQLAKNLYTSGRSGFTPDLEQVALGRKRT